MTYVTRATLFCSALFVCALHAQQPRTRHVFVAVYDQNSAPVIDLTVADFTVKENGGDAKIVRAGINLPTRIALMVDNSDAMASSLTPVRNGVQAFIDAIPAEHEIVLLTTGRQLQVRIPPPGQDRKKLKDAVTRIYPDAGSPSVLLNGFEETFNRFFRDATGKWPVIVVVTTDGPENSNMNPVQFRQFAERITDRNILVHAITLASRGVGVQSDATHTLVEATGGEFEILRIANSLPERLARLGKRVADDAAVLGRQYDIEYVSQSQGGDTTVEVIMGRSGLTPVVSQGRPIKIDPAAPQR